MTTAISETIAAWKAVRQALAEIERAEHPDVVDRFGRVWTWAGRGDLYHHDATLALSVSMIPSIAALPSPRLTDNPNYSRLCSICRSGWPS